MYIPLDYILWSVGPNVAVRRGLADFDTTDCRKATKQSCLVLRDQGQLTLWDVCPDQIIVWYSTKRRR